MSTLIKIPESLQSMVNYIPSVQIPKIIHQTYISEEKLPQIWKKTPESWKNNNPDWKYMFWGDKECRELVSEHFPDFLHIFDNYKYNIQRADAIRPILMYVYGGFYADCDIMCKKSIDDLFYKDNGDTYLIRTPTNGVVTNCIMASKKGSKFWLHIIEEMIERYNNPKIWWIGKHITVMWTTGPILFQNMYDKYNKNVDIQLLPKEMLLPSKCNICTEKPCDTLGSYTVLLSGSSWCGLDSSIMNFVLCHYHIIFIVLGVLLVGYNISVQMS